MTPEIRDAYNSRTLDSFSKIEALGFEGCDVNLGESLECGIVLKRDEVLKVNVVLVRSDWDHTWVVRFLPLGVDPVERWHTLDWDGLRGFAGSDVFPQGVSLVEALQTMLVYCGEHDVFGGRNGHGFEISEFDCPPLDTEWASSVKTRLGVWDAPTRDRFVWVKFPLDDGGSKVVKGEAWVGTDGITVTTEDGEELLGCDEVPNPYGYMFAERSTL